MTSSQGPAVPPPPDELFVRIQEALAGEYSLERELGRGGMGIVYLAREVRLARPVAIKVLPPAFAASNSARAQFFREAQTAAALSHPNIVPIHRVDEAGGFAYFVMTYVAGESLAQRIGRRGPLPPHQAARMLRDVAWALTYAHDAGIVHRDVKTDNILMETAGDRVFVTDFGIASVMQANGPATDDRIAGSVHYMSPEQIAGEPPAVASDLYSLGVVGFLALTGRLPFDAPTARDVLAMHLGTRAPSVTSLAPTVPEKLARLVEWCMAKRAADRPASAAVFARAVDEAVEPAREIPAPLRVWINDTARVEGWQVGGVLALSGFIVIPAVVATRSPVLGLVLSTATILGVGVLPSVLRVNRVIAAGYTLADMRAALREHWNRRREEALYDSARPDALSRRAVAWIFGLSAIGTALITRLGGSRAFIGVGIPILAGLLASFAFGAGILSFSDWVKKRRAPTLGSGQIKFYESTWGERFVRWASMGVKQRAVVSSLPQLTEVALGRATDALYDALPKNLKKQFKSLPTTVRRLEEDASSMHTEIDRLDASIAQLDADERANIPSATRDTEHEGAIRGERARLRNDLDRLRHHASQRLGSVVAALESIRLGLLRLQLGDVAIESLTATLDAARDVAGDVGARADAADEVRRVLGAPPLTPRASFP
jgi:serine/threonine-protein kinase